MATTDPNDPTPSARPSTFARLASAPIRWMRWLYEWVVSWANRPGGTVALSAISVAEASFFPIPPDPLMWAMCIGKQKRSLWFATVTTLSSVLGGVLGWMFGAYFFIEIVDWFVRLIGAEMTWYGTELLASDPNFEATVRASESGLFSKVSALFEDYGFWAVFIGALTPIPYKVVTVASGYFGESLAMVIFGSILGRGMRFYAFGLLFYYWGEWAKRFIERYFTILSITMAALLVGGFVLIKYMAD